MAQLDRLIGCKKHNVFFFLVVVLFFVFKQMFDVQGKKSEYNVENEVQSHSRCPDYWLYIQVYLLFVSIPLPMYPILLPAGVQSTSYVPRFTYCRCPGHWICIQSYLLQVPRPLAEYSLLLSVGTEITS